MDVIPNSGRAPCLLWVPPVTQAMLLRDGTGAKEQTDATKKLKPPAGASLVNYKRDADLARLEHGYIRRDRRQPCT